MVSIIIPTLNESRALGATLVAVQSLAGVGEVICVDGGSSDDTTSIAASQGARVLAANGGRGGQLAAGARAAQHPILWFLHADTLAPVDAITQIRKALADPRVVGGNFRLVFSGPSRPARFMSALYPRLAAIGLRYGDSGYFMRRDAYEQAGGFRSLPLFEDLDLWRRLRRCGRLCTVPGPLVTSSRRFESRSFPPVFAEWVWLQLLYWCGGDAQQLGRRYARRRPSAGGGRIA